MNTVKFSIFADLHHHPLQYFSEAEKRLEAIRKRAVENNVDFVISAGDFCHMPTEYGKIIKQFADFPMPTYHVLGNHDNDAATLEESLKAYNMPAPYYYFDKNGFRFIVLDTNYICLKGEYIHYDHSNYWQTGHIPGANGNISAEQLSWLYDVCIETDNPCVIISHDSLEREAEGLSNLFAVRETIRKINKDKRRIVMCLNGHWHVDHLRIFEDVLYMDVNSCTMDWVGKYHEKYPEALRKEHTDMDRVLIYNEPVHAICTLKEDGTVIIDGMKGFYFMNVSRADIGARPCDFNGRLFTPNVLSAKLKML